MPAATVLHPEPTPYHVALYLRVSTDDGRQDTENQDAQLRAYCEHQGWTIAEVYTDHMCGAKSSRPALDRMMLDATRGKFRAVLVWALDRLTRGGIYEAFDSIKLLRTNGVEFVSFTEPQFRTTGPAGDLLIAVAAWIAQQERLRISERTRAGLEVAKRRGAVLGRPKAVIDRQRVMDLRAGGMSLRDIANELGSSLGTVSRIVSGAR